MTRLKSAFSKKWENHYAALALYFVYYNLMRIHSTLRVTPPHGIRLLVDGQVDVAAALCHHSAR
jgi:hypothetical protein